MASSSHSAARERVPEPGTRSVVARAFVGLAIAATAFGAEAAACADPPPGAIVVFRDVPTRQAQLPGQPGQANFVDVGPDEEIVAALGAGLTPLTDEQAGAVNAPIRALPMVGASEAGPRDFGVASDARPAGGSVAIEGPMGSIGGTVTGAVSQVTSSLSALSNALAGPR